MNSTYITASEMSEYIYCECCWADRLEGTAQQTEEMVEGIVAHDRLHWRYQAIEFLRSVTLVVLVGSVVILILFGIFYYFFIR